MTTVPTRSLGLAAALGCAPLALFARTTRDSAGVRVVDTARVVMYRLGKPR